MNDSCRKPAPPRPGDVQVTARSGFACDLPSYGNLHTGIYTDGGRMCDPGAHPVQSPDDIATMHADDVAPPQYFGALGFHCEANPVPPAPWSPWAAIGLCVVVLLVALFAPRIWRAAKPLLRLGGWRP